jgi:SAM-dependent methyltransferase
MFAMSATDVQLSQSVQRTPDAIMERYRANLHWRLYEKEWIYGNFAPAGRSFVDLGCGTGEITTQLAMLGASKVVALDVTPGLLEQTRRRAELDGVSDRVQTFCGDILSVEPQPVDVVLSFAVLHHLPDRFAEVIPAIRRWIKPGGLFIAVEPICYLYGIEWLRRHSGVAYDDLDEGERKLTEADVRSVEKHFARSERTHFRLLSRFSRVWPRADRTLRQMDSHLLRLPGIRRAAGTVILVCRNE